LVLPSEPALSNPDHDRINAAVRECISRCNSQEMPLVSIGKYLDELQMNGQWKEDELSLVMATAVRVMRHLAADAGNEP
jgi:hypothetical protein